MARYIPHMTGSIIPCIYIYIYIYNLNNQGIVLSLTCCFTDRTSQSWFLWPQVVLFQAKKWISKRASTARMTKPSIDPCFFVNNTWFKRRHWGQRRIAEIQGWILDQPGVSKKNRGIVYMHFFFFWWAVGESQNLEQRNNCKDTGPKNPLVKETLQSSWTNIDIATMHGLTSCTMYPTE